MLGAIELVTQWLRALATLTENQNLLSGTHVGPRTIDCNASSRGLTPSLGFLGYLHAQACTH